MLASHKKRGYTDRLNYDVADFCWRAGIEDRRMAIGELSD